MPKNLRLLIWAFSLTPLLFLAIVCEAGGSHSRAAMTGIRLPFIENRGQVDDRVAFYAETFGATVFVTKGGEIVYSLPIARQGVKTVGVALREVIACGQPLAVAGRGLSPTQVNYFKGHDTTQWQTGLETYAQVSLGEAYPGIEVALAARVNNIEKLFFVKPGADPSQISLQIDGSTHFEVSDEGALIVHTNFGPLSFTKPVAYQEAADRTMIDVAYVVRDNTYGFHLGEYDPAREVIIDPLLASTFLGGGADEYGITMAIDDAGCVYVGGETNSAEFPTTSSAYGEIYFGGTADAFISKFDADLTTLLASTFLGGMGFDSGGSIILDAAGNVYFDGVTGSPDFPTTSGALDQTFNGGTYDGFVSKLDADLATLIASTFLGGTSDDFGHHMAFDAAGNLLVCGETSSADFPVTLGVYDEGYNGGNDPYVAKLDAELATLHASTYIGGTNNEGANFLTVDSGGDIFITGYTDSNNYPTTANAFDESYNGGGFDGFVSRLDGDLTTLAASTYFGGSHMDYGYSIIADPVGDIYVTGWSHSQNFPTSAGAYDESYNGGFDMVVLKFDNDLATLPAATFCGGSIDDGGGDIKIDDDGYIYIAGIADSYNFPTTPNAYDQTHNGGSDACLLKLDRDLTRLLASTYIGSSHDELAFGMALDANGNVYATGATESVGFPTTPGSYDVSHNGSRDIFVVKLDRNLSADGASVPEGNQTAIISLYGNQPNPVRRDTTIRYRLRDDAHVDLHIYNPLGRRIRTLVNETQSAGLQGVVWDGADDFGRPVPSGSYFYQITTESGVLRGEMLLVR